MSDYKWCEINIKDWDKLSESTREIFLAPAIEELKEGEKSRLSFAGRADVLAEYNIEPIREINAA